MQSEAMLPIVLAFQEKEAEEMEMIRWMAEILKAEKTVTDGQILAKALSLSGNTGILRAISSKLELPPN